MERKIFKKKNVIDSAVSIALGGVSNVAADFALAQIPQVATVDQKYIDLGKFAVGVLASTMVGNKYVKDAANGIAVVGIANFAKALMDEQMNGGEQEAPAGVPGGTVGAIGRRSRLPLSARNKMQRYAKGMNGSASAFIS